MYQYLDEAITDALSEEMDEFDIYADEDFFDDEGFEEDEFDEFAGETEDDLLEEAIDGILTNFKGVDEFLTSRQLSRAVKRNRYWSRKLGWQKYYDTIVSLLASTGCLQPNYTPGWEDLSEAVACWQQRQQPRLTADGIIGRNTWGRMKAVIPMISSPVRPAESPKTIPTQPTGIPPLGGPKIPPNFKPVKRKGTIRGLARYGGDRLDRTLLTLKRKGLIQVSNEDIDTFQRIANVETGGLIQAINTWDSAVVSIGFMQWTLQHGKLQEWIRRDQSAFRRYGIALDESRYYTWLYPKGKVDRQTAIKGAATKDELRWDGWAERFYLAGLDSEIITAEVPLAREHLQRHLNGLRRKLSPDDFSVFKAHYDRSLQIRGVFQAAYNNLPVAAQKGTTNALQRAKKVGVVTTKDFLKILQKAILDAYKDRQDDGTRIVTETEVGARFG